MVALAGYIYDTGMSNILKNNKDVKVIFEG